MISVTYNNINSYTNLGLILEERPIMPILLENVENIPIEGRDGTLTRKLGTYNDRKIICKFIVLSNANLPSKLSSIVSWLDNMTGTLSFSFNPSKTYTVKAIKCSDNIQETLSYYGRFEVEFLCEPFDTPPASTSLIHVYGKTATKSTVLNTEGLTTLDDICTKCEIKEILNGEYGLSAIFQLDKLNNKEAFLVEEAIIKCPDIYGDEVFRIKEVTKRTNGKEIEIYARHISYDTMNLFIESASITNGNGSAFLTALFGATTTSHEFTYSSNLTNTSTSDYANMTLYEALFSDQYCFLNCLGGEILRRQYDIQINTVIGVNNGVSIESQKNLQGFEIHTNMDNIVTRIYPFGASDLTIPEKYIDSAHISDYAMIRSKKVSFSDIGVDEAQGITEAMAQQMLRDEVAKMYSIDEVDILKAEYSVDFVDISKTEEWKNMNVLVDVGLGDVIAVYEENFNINITVRDTERTFDCIDGLVTSIVLSNVAKKRVPNLRKLSDKVEQVDDFLAENFGLDKYGYGTFDSAFDKCFDTAFGPAFDSYAENMHPKIYTGTTTPSSGLGIDGDIYIQY